MTDTKPKGILAEGLNLLAQPDVEKALAAVEKIKNLIRVETSSHIQSQTAGRGFSYLELNSIRKAGTNPADKMESVFKLVAKSAQNQFLALSNIPTITQETILRALDEIGEMAALEGDEYKATEQSIYFKDGQGHGYAVVMGFDTPANNPTKRTWYYTWYSAAFGLMPDVMVIRHTKSNFFGSSSRDQINYVARGITENDMKELLKMCLSLHLTSSEVCTQQSLPPVSGSVPCLL
jgi:hypothetical protein